MKFGKKYHQYLESEARALRLQGCSYVEFKRHKKLLKKCPHAPPPRAPPAIAHSCSLHLVDETTVVASALPPCQTDSTASLPRKCFSSCAVCDANFFPTLMEEISAVVDWFNSRAQQLLDCHLASGFRKYLLLFKRSVATDQRALIQEGKILVNYASMNAIAIRKILKKYDKVHSCDEGRAFRARLQTMHAELLQSPWLIELAALYINLSDSNSSTTLSLPDGFAICKWDFNGDRPVILCTLLDSLKLELDLTCSICLDTVFDPVSLACGHIFCNSCACSAASILTVQGLKVANRAAKCPLCRLDDVYMSALHLAELNILIKNRCRGYWEERLQRERTERLQQVKEHWDKQVQAVMGL